MAKFSDIRIKDGHSGDAPSRLLHSERAHRQAGEAPQASQPGLHTSQALPFLVPDWLLESPGTLLESKMRWLAGWWWWVHFFNPSTPVAEAGGSL